MFRIKTTSNYAIFIILIITICLACNVALAETDSPSYLVGTGDVLEVFVWKEPDLSREVTVMPDGKITYPLIGEITVQGQTVTYLKDIITEKLMKYLDVPEVTVIVRESRSRRIYVIGKVNSPGTFVLDAEMTILQAITTAGGFTEWADTKNILIIHKEGKKEIQFRFNYKKYISGKDMEQNIILKPNDTIVVP